MRRISALLMALGILVTLFAVFPQRVAFASGPHVLGKQTVSQQSVTCSGNGCTGLDPIATGCSASAQTVLTSPIWDGPTQVGTINLRFSSACNTNWAQILVGSVLGSTDVRAEVTRAGGVDGPQDQRCEPNDCVGTIFGSFAYTDMVWAPDVPARASGVLNNGVGFVNVCITQDRNALPC